MGIVKEVRAGEIIPAWYGVAWTRWEVNSAICYPMPLNLIVAAARAVVIWMRYGYMAMPRHSRDAYAQGIRDGSGARGLVTTEIEMSEYKSMFEQAVRTLAAIDDALGIGGDGCCDPEQTLDAIAELKAAASRGVELARSVMSDNVGKA